MKVMDSIFDLKDDLKKGLLSTKPQDTHFVIPSEIALINVFSAGNDVYRRIETPMTEREAFIEAARDLWVRDDLGTSYDVFAEMFDSGKFKLVD